MLSDWEKTQRAVAVEVLKRRLFHYGIKQIGIFADACQSLPSNLFMAELASDPVLGKGPEQQVTVDVDKFTATQDGDQTFAIPGNSPELDRCLFSGVLLEGLWGLQPNAYSRYRPDHVTSNSLGQYLREEVPKRADEYGLKVKPSIVSTFAEGQDVYFSRNPDTPKPNFTPWPPNGTGPTPYLGKIRKMGRSARDPLKAEIRRHRDAESQKAAAAFYERLRKQRLSNPWVRTGFLIDGAEVLRLWSSENVLVHRWDQSNSWRIHIHQDTRVREPAPLLIEFANGRYGAVTVLPRFLGSIQTGESGISAIVYRGEYSFPDDTDSAERVLSQLEQGAVRAADMRDWAVNLRQGKHADPVLGVVCAYLYDAIGDVDNIRRMAYYYVRHRQPIPYDIALLGQLRGRRHGNILHATVPATRAGEAQTEEEQRFDWTHNDTPEVEGVVGGVWPWMRQGWTYLDAPTEDGSNLILPGLLEARPHLTSARFATFDRWGASILRMAFSLDHSSFR